MAIEGFHGSRLRMYDANFNSVATSKFATPFGHAIWGGEIAGRDYFLFGWRAEKQGLELIKDLQLDATLIGEHLGPSNVTVFAKNKQQYLLSANREANEVAVYQISTK